MNFQKTAIVIAVVLLVVILALVGYAFYNKKYTESFPPVVAQCPDYWELQADSSVPSGHVCANVKKLGSTNCESRIDFSVAPWVGSQGLCNKQGWAKNCGLVWDGVTNAGNAC